MYKHLLAGCALAALTLAAGAANAQDFKVTISGDAEFQASFGGQKHDNNTHGVDFRNRLRLKVNPEAVGLNGALTYGALVRLRAQDKSSNENFDRAYTYASGAFGTVIAGVHTTYNDDIGAVTAPSDWRPESDVALAFVNSSKDSYGSGVGGLAAWRWDTLASVGANTKLRYQSPVISGFQFAAGYTPYSTAVRDGSIATAWSFVRDKANVNDSYEVGLKFDSADKSIKDVFGDAILRASLDYQGGKSKSVSYGAQKDLSSFQAGLQVGYQGFLVGGGVAYFGKSGLNKFDQDQAPAYTWRAGAQYTTGPYMFGVTYDYSQKDADFDTADTATTWTSGKKQAQQFGAGLSYTVAKGLVVTGEYDYVKTKNTFSNISDNANVVTLSTKLSF